MKTNPNDPAMPATITITLEGIDYSQEANVPGLSKLEHFAAMAMQGMLASPNVDMYGGGFKGIGEASVAAAQALIKALNEASPSDEKK